MFLDFSGALPFDLVGAFSFTEFLYKSAIVFLSLAAVVLIYTFVVNFYYAAVIENALGPAEPPDKGDDKHVRWRDLSAKRLWMIIFTSVSSIAIFIAVIFLSEPSELPRYFPEVMPMFMVFVLLLRPAISLSMDRNRWLLVKGLYLATLILIVPIAVGFQDSKIFEDPSRNILVEIDGQACGVAFFGTSKTIVRCDSANYLLETSDREFQFQQRP